MLLVLAVCGGTFNMYETRAHAHTDIKNTIIETVYCRQR